MYLTSSVVQGFLVNVLLAIDVLPVMREHEAGRCAPGAGCGIVDCETVVSHQFLAVDAASADDQHRRLVVGLEPVCVGAVESGWAGAVLGEHPTPLCGNEACGPVDHLIDIRP